MYTTEINLSDLILANALGGSHLSAADPSDPLARINLDLEVHLAEPWELDTNLLKLQGRAQGPFYIRGTLTKPGLKGRMELLPGGRLTNLFPAGDIVIERGTVDFPDPAVFNPNFDVQGQIDIPPYLVTLEINGALDALQARPFSTPSLRQDEIFAILIDPAAVTQVGGAPGSSSQTLVTTGLAGTSTGLLTSLALANFQEQLRKTLGLDRVSVALRAGTGTPETSVTLGKSVNLFGYRTPLVFTRDKDGEVTTISRPGGMAFRQLRLPPGRQPEHRRQPGPVRRNPPLLEPPMIAAARLRPLPGTPGLRAPGAAPAGPATLAALLEDPRLAGLPAGGRCSR